MLCSLLLSFALLHPQAPQNSSAHRQGTGAPQLSYELALDLEAEQLVFEAWLTDLDPEEQHIELRMTEEYAFLNQEEPLLAGPVRAFDGRGVELEVLRNSAFNWTLKRGAAKRIRLDWSALLTHREVLGKHSSDAFEHPYLAADHGLFSMPASFVRVPLVDAQNTRIRIELPEGWALHSPWIEVGEGWFRPARDASMDGDYFAVGNWEEHTVAAGGARVSVLFAPNQEALAKAALPLIAPVLREELEVFAHEPFGRYLVFFGRPDDPGMGGSPKDLTMTVFVAGGSLKGAILDQVAHVIAHEFFHTWSFSRFDSVDELRFINEGFTDFFAYLIPSRLELVGSGLFPDALCAALGTWERTPLAGRLSMLEAGGPAFFEGGDANQLIYQGGMVLAALLDVSLMNAENPSDLAEFMRQFINDKRWSRGGLAPGLSDFEALLAMHLGTLRAQAWVALLRSREVPDLVALFEAQGVEFERREVPPSMDLRANLEGTTLADLDPSGTAWRVGLRAGDRILSIGGKKLSNAADLRRAWSSQRGRVQVRLERAGEQLSLDEPLEKVVLYRLSESPWIF